MKSATTAARSLCSGVRHAHDEPRLDPIGQSDGVAAESVELFGSRTDPTARGGDIDLLILTAAPRLDTARQVCARFFLRCEERIDVVVPDPDRLTTADEAFLPSLHRVRIT